MLIQITEFKIINWRHREKTNLFLRVIANDSFVTDSGLSIEAGSASTAWHFPLTYNANDTVDSQVLPTLSSSSIFIHSTLDAKFNPLATYRFEIVNSRGAVIEVLEKARMIHVPAQATITWAELLNFNSIAFTSINEISLKEFFSDLLKQLTSTNQVDTTPRINVKTEFGAKGDGVTNDSLAFNNAIANAKVTGKTVYIPPGEYKVEITEALSKVKIQGAGFSSVLKARANDVPVINVSGANSGVGFVLEKLVIRGAGKTSGLNGHGIFIDDSNSAALFTIRDVKIEDCGGKGVFIPKCFNYIIEKVTVDECGDNCFEIQGGNTGTLMNCYAQTVAAGKVGYRIYNGHVVLINCNGIDNDSGTNAKWGEFGKDTTHHGVNDFASPTLIGCNIEDFKETGILLHQGSGINVFSSFFTTSTAAGNYRAIVAEFIAESDAGYIDGISRFVLTGAAAWANGTPIHSNGPIFFANAADFSTIHWNGVTYGYPNITPRFLPGTNQYLLDITRARVQNLEASTVRGDLTFATKTTDGTQTKIVFNEDSVNGQPLITKAASTSTGLRFSGTEPQFLSSGNLTARFRTTSTVLREHLVLAEDIAGQGVPPGEPGMLHVVGSSSGVSIWKRIFTSIPGTIVSKDRYILSNRNVGLNAEFALSVSTEGDALTFFTGSNSGGIKGRLVVAPALFGLSAPPGVEPGQIDVLGSNAGVAFWRTSTSDFISSPTLGDRFIVSNRATGFLTNAQSLTYFQDGIGDTFRNSYESTHCRRWLLVTYTLNNAALGSFPSVDVNGRIDILGSGSGLSLWKRALSSFTASPAVGDVFDVYNAGGALTIGDFTSGTSELSMKIFPRAKILLPGSDSALGYKSRSTDIATESGMWVMYVFDDGTTRELRMRSPNGTVNTIATLTL